MGNREWQRAWRAANPEKSRARSRAWAKANPEKRRAAANRRNAANRAANAEEIAARREAKKAATKERQRAKARAYYRANREKRLAYCAAWRKENPGNHAAWKALNPDKVRADRRGRKIAKRKEIREVLTRAQRGKCAICRERLGADSHLDHIMPKKLGGSNARSNLQLTCPTCNLTKNAQHPIDHARSLGRLL